MYRLVPCIPIFKVFFIKSSKRMCICDYVKIALVLVKNVFFGLKKGISLAISVLDSCKTYCLRVIVSGICF